MLERFFCYSQRVQLAASEIRQDQRLEIRQDADFFLRGLGFLCSSGAIAGRFRRADQSWFTGSDFFHLSGFMNTAGFARPTPIHPQIRYPQSSAFVYDLQDLGGAGDANIYPLLWGVERYQDGSLPGPALPAKYIEEPHTITVVQSVVGANPILSIPIQCQTGEPFIVRTLTCRFDESIGTSLTMACRIWDEYTRLYMNDWVPVRLLFAGINETTQLYPSVTFPEWTIPAKGAYLLDLWNRTEAGPFTVELAFGGVRLVAV